MNHAEIQSGIHQGHRASGQYGLMPNTVQEMATRMKRDDQLPENLSGVFDMDPDDIKRFIEESPDAEQAIASYMADRALSRQGDPEKAAYSWLYGHNLRPEQIAERGYQDDPYVQKYRKYRDDMFAEVEQPKRNSVTKSVDEPPKQNDQKYLDQLFPGLRKTLRYD